MCNRYWPNLCSFASARVDVDLLEVGVDVVDVQKSQGGALDGAPIQTSKRVADLKKKNLLEIS